MREAWAMDPRPLPHWTGRFGRRQPCPGPLPQTKPLPPMGKGRQSHGNRWKAMAKALKTSFREGRAGTQPGGQRTRQRLAGRCPEPVQQDSICGLCAKQPHQKGCCAACGNVICQSEAQSSVRCRAVVRVRPAVRPPPHFCAVCGCASHRHCPANARGRVLGRCLIFNSLILRLWPVCRPCHGTLDRAVKAQRTTHKGLGQWLTLCQRTGLEPIHAINASNAACNGSRNTSAHIGTAGKSPGCCSM